MCASLIKNHHVHTKEESFTCEMCFRGFFQKDHQKYLLLYAKEELLIWEMCFNGFSQSDSLKKHHHCVLSEKKIFACDKCF